MATNPINETNEEARTRARELLRDANFAALAVIHPETQVPHVTRIALVTMNTGQPITLISTLSTHTQALLKNPNCSLLVGEPQDKGDPLNHPRITLACQAKFIDRSSEQHTDLRTFYLGKVPKSKLYIDFADFTFVSFDIQSADLNGGFGKAFKLQPNDF